MRFRLSICLAISALAITACSQPGTPASTAPASSAASPTPSVAPSAAVSPAAQPSASPAAAPSALPAAQPTPLSLPPDAPPQIVAVELSDPVFHSGENVSGTVVTSTNVAAVDVRVANQSRRLPQTAPGIFSMSYTVPKIPFFLRGTYTARVIAQNTAGVTVEKDVSVTLR